MKEGGERHGKELARVYDTVGFSYFSLRFDRACMYARSCVCLCICASAGNSCVAVYVRARVCVISVTHIPFMRGTSHYR